MPPVILAAALAGQSLCAVAVGVVFLLLHSFASGIFMVVSDQAIHARIDSATRATVLSVKNMLSTLLFAAISPAVGLLADTSSLSAALMLLALGALAVGAASLVSCPPQAPAAPLVDRPPQ